MKTLPSGKADSPKKSGSAAYLWVITFILALYSYQSFMQGMLTGNRESERGMVYVLLVTLIILMAVPVFLGPPLPRGTAISRCMWALFAWALFVDVLRGTDSWTVAVRLGLAFWWPITYIFMARLGLRNQRGRELVPRIMAGFFVFFCLMTLVSIALIQQRESREQGVAGMAYYVLEVSPFIFLLEHSWVVRFSLLTVGVFAVGFSNKRGAIIATVGMFLAVGFVYSRAGLANPRRLLALMTVPVLFLFTFWYLNRLSAGFLLSRFEGEQLSSGSGRVDIWQETLAAVQEGSWGRKFIGGGSGATLELVGTGAHNEWIEFLNCYGLVGVLLLVILLGAIFMTALRYLRAGKSDRAAAAIATFALSLEQTLFSGLYFVHQFFFSAAVLGFLRGLELLDSQNQTADRAGDEAVTKVGYRHGSGVARTSP